MSLQRCMRPFSGGLGVSPIFKTGGVVSLPRCMRPFSGGLGVSPIFKKEAL